MENKLLTTEEVAAMLQVSTKTVRKYVQAGELEVVSIGARGFRFDPKDVAAFVEKRKERRETKREG